jgi:predicted metal-binding membrane protein
MEMPGGWTMCLMWMRMPGQTWFASTTGFLLMWLAMMVAMMLPSALPTFLSTKRAPVSLSVMATGYFATWLAVGAGLYAAGIAFAAATMHWQTFSRAVPVLSGAALIAAGVFQFTRWKNTALFRCRSPFGCLPACPERETDFRLGCKQGAACCLCCVAPMMIQLVLGMMNPLVMVGVAIVIAAEKILPRPEIMARIVGIAAIVFGITLIIHKVAQ